MVGRRVDSRPKHRVGMRDGHRIDAESDDSYAHLGAGDPSGRIAGGDQGADAFCDRRSARLDALERNANESVLDLEAPHGELTRRSHDESIRGEAGAAIDGREAVYLDLDEGVAGALRCRG